MVLNLNGAIGVITLGMMQHTWTSPLQSMSDVHIILRAELRND